MFEHAAQCIARRQLMDKAEEPPDLTRIQILPLFYPFFIKPESQPLQLLSLPVSTHTDLTKKFL